MPSASASFDNYILTGDVASIAVCWVIVILLLTSYISRTRSFRIFMVIVIQLIVASSVNIAYHQMLSWNDPGIYWLIYALRVFYYALLFDVFFLFSLYATIVSDMKKKKASIIAVISSTLFAAVFTADIIRSVCGYGYTVAEDGSMQIAKTNLYTIGYILFIILIFVVLFMIRKLLYKRVMIGFYATMSLSVAVRFALVIMNQSSLTTLTFVLPVLAMLYLIHSSPYNVALGSVDARALEDTVKNLYEKKEPFFFISLLMPELNEGGKQIPKDMRNVIRKISSHYFSKGVLIEISSGHLVAVVSKKRSPDYEQLIEGSMGEFYKYYEHFRYAFKIVIGDSADEISRKNDYIRLIMNTQRKMQENTVYHITRKDIADFSRTEYIIHELGDIYNKHDFNDERVLAYCQPVYNIKTGKFDTAEALMRLRLPELDLVSPEEFIPLAESNGYIHILTEMILHKTCSEVNRIVKNGYHIERISVNVSMPELKDKEFCNDITKIIKNNGVKGSQIALEITESRSEADFIIIKDKINSLRGLGTKFYLDDFGTGYSNIERIIELPFDIIKFDKSMVTSIRSDKRSKKLIENFATLFKDMGYAILYEGVETETDEQTCRSMYASYLQGYKYSRPIPMEQLEGFLSKKV